ncbi:MAG: hypothetical protein FWF77_04570 [Defluviitaleaceae bacterium]|nr:hypothetical protein [Defluviitaleaceae bacterium]
MINKALLVEQLKRFWAIPAIAALLFVLVVYIPALMPNQWAALRNVVDIISFGNLYMLLIMVATPVAAAFCVFGSFFNKRAATAFYAMPLSKNQIFATNAAAGLILSVLPVLFFCVVLLLPMAFHQNIRDEFAAWEAAVSIAESGFGHMQAERLYQFVPQYHLPRSILPAWHEYAPINSLPVIAGLFLRMLLATVFYFGVAWLAFSLAGHGFSAVVIVGVLPFLPTAARFLGEMAGLMYVFGFPSLNPDMTIMMFLAYHNPAAWGLIIRHNFLPYGHAVIIPALIYIVLGAAIYAGAFFVSRARRPERTGMPVMFAPVKNVLIFLMSFLGMILLGSLFLTIDNSAVMMYVGFVAGFAIGYVGAQMIAEKSFHIGGKLRFFPRFAGVAAGIFVAMLLITQFGVGFYINRVPHEDEIAGVFVTNGWWLGGIPDDEWARIAVSDPDFIAATREAHETILAARSELHNPPFFGAATYVRELADGTFETRENLTIQYFLHNGRTVQRQYSITGDFINDAGLEAFLTRREVVLAPYTAFRMPEHIRGIALHFNTPIVELGADGHVLVFESGRNFVQITDPDEIAVLLEIIADGGVETATQMRRQRVRVRDVSHDERMLREWLAENPAGWEWEAVRATDAIADLIAPPSLRINFDINWFDAPMAIRTQGFHAPFVQGDAVLRIWEQVAEWGHVVEDVVFVE